MSTLDKTEAKAINMDALLGLISVTGNKYNRNISG